MALISLKKISTKCPGSLMLAGEHAVLYGQPALVAAINKYLCVELDIVESEKQLAEIVIETTLEHESYTYHSYLEQLEIAKPFDFVLSAIQYYKKDLVNHHYIYKFKISSDINTTMGLGSSAAVTMAMVKVLENAINWMSNLPQINFETISVESINVLKKAQAIVRAVQGSGSGSDLAASLYGGVIYLNADLSKVERISNSIPLIAVYSGYKLSTRDVIAKVALAMNAQNNKQAELYQNIFHLIGGLVDSAREHIQQKEWEKLGQIFNFHYDLQNVLLLSDVNIENIANILKKISGIKGVKISGSGLGDCVIAIADSFDNIPNLIEKYKNYNQTSLHQNQRVLDDIVVE